MMVTILKSSPNIVRSSASTTSSKLTRCGRTPIIMSSISLLILFMLLTWQQYAGVVAVSTEELVSMIRDLKGTDERLMRWDASEHTSERQKEGACEKLLEVAEMLIKEKDDTRQRLACEYATWCITDSPVS